MWQNIILDITNMLYDATTQSNIYSSYYNGNVVKGGIFLQLQDWIGEHKFWMGAVSDVEYFHRSGILEQQNAFVGYGTEFVNLLDQGYQAECVAMHEVNQIILQSAFVPIDQKFNNEEVVLSAVVASDCSGNKRAVKR